MNRVSKLEPGGRQTGVLDWETCMRESSHVCTVSIGRMMLRESEDAPLFSSLHARSQMVLPYTLKTLETSRGLTLLAICTLRLSDLQGGE